MSAGRRRGLGRGLDALLGPQPAAAAAGEGELRQVPLEWLVRGRHQPRREFDPAALEELADSIRSQGILQPIVVRPLGPERFEIVAGERRWRAAQLAGLTEVPVLVREVGDEAAMAMALIENLQREDLNPVEEALALKRLQEEFGYTQQQVAEAVGKSRSAVANLIRLLALEEEVRILLERGDLETGHAKALLGLSGRVQVEAARQVVGKGLTVRQTEGLVRRLLAGHRAPPAAKRSADPDLERLAETVSERVGLPTRIEHARGGGRITFRFTRLEELEGLLERLGVARGE
ncbi:MAG: chromosome partitioning protein ParB [Porticoccaceae bacterium]|nr:MAG: chromosome partitioning protein ParB [Porticoccaceae bacterium]